MSKKTSGLGRGLGDLLEDNAPELRSSSVIRRGDDGDVSVSPIAVSYIKEDNNDADTMPLVFPTVTPISGGNGSSAEGVSDTAERVETAKNTEEKSAADELPRTRSLKAVFRNFK